MRNFSHTASIDRALEVGFPAGRLRMQTMFHFFRPIPNFAVRAFLFCAVLLGTPASTMAGIERTALVIGNARYEPTTGPLRNTGNDAKSVAKALRSLGFSVIERHDVTRDQLMKGMEEFRKTLSDAEVALFYYAGHGISVAGSNYLIPIHSGFDTDVCDETALRMAAETHLFNAEQAVADMSASGARCNLIILDACRNTPLSRSVRSRSLTGHPGLSEMTPPAGSLIAFSTDAGKVAFDGDGTNGLYTEELLKFLRTPGLTIEQVFKRTRAGVLARTQGAQVPAEYSRLVGEDIYLAGTILPAIPVLPAALPDKPKDPPPAPLSMPDLVKLASTGQTSACIRVLESCAGTEYLANNGRPVLEALLDRVRDDIKDARMPTPKIVASLDTCSAVLRLLPMCLKDADPKFSELAAKAHNRKGDAFLILARPEEALPEFDAAQPLAPNDAFILYNRGRAKLALGRTDDAIADFSAALGGSLAQPKAKRLARQALADISKSGR